MSTLTDYWQVIRRCGIVFTMPTLGMLLVFGCSLTKERRDNPTSFSPIMPEQVRGSAPLESVTAYRPPIISPIPEQQPAATGNKEVSSVLPLPKETSDKTPSQTAKPDPTVEKLKQQIEELEKQLARKPVLATTHSSVPKTLPVIDIPGVTAFSDEKTVRITVLDTHLFVPSTCQLIPSAEETLRKIAGEIRANYPDALLEIEGHTDGKSTDPANVTQAHDISSAKSLAVMNYFVKSLRWDAVKIKTTSWGSSKPVADDGTTEGRSKNNRIELVVIPCVVLSTR